ncbi:RNA polymerase, sigma 54 subunit, RpoN/SigL [Virgibacillus subterraneus]|uniref:RNA polymerase, sigma 54 subunit, RpoN/SigL n=1 Tax=Virgibacillus subterraneus TaxID=621109 RepID=A0A1H9BUZ4_9BACI|nr:RNA polymerase factor sigma-54 [Virgibacillus subterraneus]SEP92722.1 RNA polymerase, sigma 54 subunit, RpoN/SigL [Virgibacillus subterraneus]
MVQQKLKQEQTLQLKMNQSLLQSIHLLQFTGIEIIEYIKEISKENPLIEEVNYDYEITKYKNSNADQPSIGEINQATLSMYEQLKNQLYMLNVPSNLEPVVSFGIDSLNDDGYLDIELNIWAENCNTTIEKVEQALALIQSLEPAGIGARTLQECIQLQMDKSYPYIGELLQEHLDWVAEENISAISVQYQLTEDKASVMLEEIKSCHPKPGKLLSQTSTEYIIPEANIYEEDGKWKISFYKWNSPAIEINESYTNLMANEKEAEDYLKEKFKQVDWLKHAISFRSNTLENVIRNIVDKQQMYFEHGSFMLQPLTLKDIATELRLHISTVSRAISNKYVQTKHGVIPLKFFLQSGVKQSDGQQTSSFVIKQLIFEMLKHENKHKPLSDQMIKNRLYEEFSISIARRTVMKYREQLGIASSTKRK